jgi:hypothetical protein
VALAQKSAKRTCGRGDADFEPPHWVFEPFLPIFKLALRPAILYKRGLIGIFELALAL